MNIGQIDLGDKPVMLAPMEDVTDASFRGICKEQGADMVYTEFIPAEGLIRDAKKAYAKLKTSVEEAPIGIQIYGSDPDAMVEAARMADHAEQIVGGHGCDLIDINFGCPVSKIAARGAGSGMMKEPDKMVMITKRIVEAVGKPVTVKTRLGWDDRSKIIVELAERLQDCVIGNGDINSAAKAKDAFDRYGVDGIMVARASFGRPWIFREIKHLLRTGEELPPPGVRERVELAKRHFRLSVELKGLPVGVYEMRRHLSCYFKGLPDFKETRMRLVTENDPEEVLAILDHIADRWGDTPLPAASGVYDI